MHRFPASFTLLPRATIPPLNAESHPHPTGSTNDSTKGEDVWPSDDAGDFSPSPTDVQVVRAMLTSALRLPELAMDIILDFAEYWARSSTMLRTLPTVDGSHQSENSFLLRSYPVGLVNLGGQETDVPPSASSYISGTVKPAPLSRAPEARTFAKLAKYPTPRLVSPVRKVVFSIRSKDQGWAGDTTSWTWFDAGLEKFDADHSGDANDEPPSNPASTDSINPLSLEALRPLHPKFTQNPATGTCTYTFPLAPEDEWLVVRNRLKERQWRNHIITWSYLDDISPESEEAKRLEEDGRGRATATGEFVRGLRFGDVVTLWAKARFPGWRNQIMAAQIDVYWAV